MTSVRQVAVANVAGTALPIPDHAQKIRVMTDNPAQAVITLNIFPAGAAPVAIYTGTVRTADPGTDAAAFPVVLGGRTFTITSSTNANVFAVFDMVP